LWQDSHNAIAFARRSKARLVIAKLDRLARNVAFLSAIMEAGTDFMACDHPNANRLTIHTLAAVAEEARRISERTKAALSAAKARDTLLGSARPDLWAGREDAWLAGLLKAREQSRVSKREKALAGVADLVPIMREHRAGGTSLAAIAKELNAVGPPNNTGERVDRHGCQTCLGPGCGGRVSSRLKRNTTQETCCLTARTALALRKRRRSV
jgi:DNA invertase Pin-like site-specific DNA recombinase